MDRTLQDIVARQQRAEGDLDRVKRVISEGVSGGGGGVVDHGLLTGLADDDHAQYHNDARGDARYYTQAQVNSSLAGKANTSHTHAQSDVTNLVTDLAAKAPLASPALTGTPTVPTAATATNTTQAASTAFVQANAALKANTSHTHAQSDVTNLVTDLAAKAPLGGATFTGAVQTEGTAFGIGTRNSGDTQPRAQLLASTSGSLRLGSGSASPDWVLYRSASNVAALLAGDDLRRPAGEDGTHDDSMIRKAQLDTALGAYLTTASAAATYATIGHSHAFSAITGLLGIAQINASGTPSATTYLRGDGTWSTPAGGGGASGGPMNGYASHPANVNITTTAEILIASVTLTAIASTKYMITASCSFLKDASTTVRRNNLILKRGTTLLASSKTSSAAIASTEYGAPTIPYADTPGAGSVTYNLYAQNLVSTTVSATDIHLEVFEMTGVKGDAGAGVATGGSTGQALVKASGTDFDTAWANVISDSLLTTRGDIITRSASAPQRLALGASGATLTSDGTDATWTAKPTITGVSYTTPWADFGGGYRGFYYTKDRDGLVTVTGMAKRVGTSSVSTIFTLPAGFRPASTILIPSATSTGFVNLELRATGAAVTGLGSGTDSYVAFSCTFFAEA